MANTATAATTTRRATRAERALYARRALAYHEAGHAVAALVVKGRRFRYVTIARDPENGSRGHCEFIRWPRNMDPDTASRERLEPFLRKEIIVALAGGAAEAWFHGRRNYVGAEGDYASAKTYAKWATGCRDERDKQGAWADWCEQCEWSKKSDCATYLSRLWKVAEQLVARELPAITALAEALLERETIRCAEAREIVREGWLREAFAVRPLAAVPAVADLADLADQD